MVKKEAYIQLIPELKVIDSVELLPERREEINRLFEVLKVKNKQRIILHARPANLHHIPLDDLEMPQAGYSPLLALDNQEELGIGKLYIHSFYHLVSLLLHLRTLFGLPPVLQDGRDFWPQLRSVPMGWPHSVTISQSIYRQVPFPAARLDDKNDGRGGSSKVLMACRFG